MIFAPGIDWKGGFWPVVYISDRQDFWTRRRSEPDGFPQLSNFFYGFFWGGVRSGHFSPEDFHPLASCQACLEVVRWTSLTVVFTCISISMPGAKLPGVQGRRNLSPPKLFDRPKFASDHLRGRGVSRQCPGPKGLTAAPSPPGPAARTETVVLHGDVLQVCVPPLGPFGGDWGATGAFFLVPLKPCEWVKVFFFE